MNSYIIGFGGGTGGGNGAQGPQGPQGADGLNGPQGPQGPASESGTGTYINPNNVQYQIGGVLKNTNFQNGINIQQLFDKIFFPNIDTQFPDKPIFIGITESEPNVSQIIQLSKPASFYEFGLNQHVDEGCIVIALPSIYYLKSIHDENNFNVLNSFELIYKSIQTESISDIYNVYISNRVYYYNTLALTLTTEFGLPVQTHLINAVITVNNIQPVINSVSIVEAIKPVIEKVTISTRDLQPILKSVVITPDLDISLYTVSIRNFEYDAVLNYVSIGQIAKPTINSVSIVEEFEPTISNISIVEAIKPSINSVSIVEEFKPTINSISIVEAIKPSISNVTITFLKLPIINSVSITEAIKSIIHNVQISQYV